MAEADLKGLRVRFEKDGYLHLKGFSSLEECDKMQQRMQDLIAKWDPEETMAPVFTTDGNQQKQQGNSDYFLDSADRIHFFLEKDAAGEDGKLKPEVSKLRSLNKVGHGLHVVDDAFREYSYSSKVVDLVQELGYTDPVLPQSMYIFKQPNIGGEVTSHQDSCFLHTTPRETCLGLWLALDAATLTNGCLWARPGSHKEPVRRLFLRNPQYFEEGDKTAHKMIFEKVDIESEAMSWEGKLPPGSEPPSKGLQDKGFVPLECARGDLVVIHGQIDHLSLANSSDAPRETYQLHLIEGPQAGVSWGHRNWLQYPVSRPFPSLAPGRCKRKADEL